MAFPQDHITLLVELALGADVTANPSSWSWTDATNYVHLGQRGHITITRGRQDQASLADTSRLSMSVDNRDGRWSTRNPMGAWFGQLRKGTPIRVSAEGHVRFTGFLSALPPRWDLSEQDRWVEVEAQGLLYRLTQGRSGARSPMWRYLATQSPAAWWPMQTPASQVPGVAAMRILDGQAGWQVGKIEDWLETGLGLSPTYGVVRGTASIGSSQDGATDLVIKGQPGFTGDTFQFNQVRLDAVSAGVNYVASVFGDWNAGTPTLSLVTNSGVVDTASDEAARALWDNRTHHWRILLEQSGADVDITVYLDAAAVLSATDTSVTLTRAVRLESGGSYAILGQAVVWAGTAPSVSDAYDAMLGHPGEMAHDRFLRLGTEFGVRTVCAGTTSQAMGPERAQTFVELVRECEASDQAFLYEGLDFDLVLQTLRERYNQTPSLELDYTTPGHVAPPLEPTDDDRYAINDVTVKRSGTGETGGAEFRVVNDDPADELSIPNIGRRDEEITLNVADDWQAEQIAHWRLHLAEPTARELRLQAGHEAGHCVIAHHFGLEIHHATVLGPLGHGEAVTRDAADPWTNALVAAGGMAAHYSRRGPAEQWYPADHDIAAITALVGADRIKEAIREAYAILWANRAAYLRLTDALHLRNHLTGANITAVLGQLSKPVSQDPAPVGDRSTVGPDAPTTPTDRGTA